MMTFPTLTEARNAAPAGTVRILKIEHDDGRECFICAKTTLDHLRKVIADQPGRIPVKRLIAEYEVKTDEQIAAETEQMKREESRCERCGCKVDGNTCYSQREWMRWGSKPIRVTAYYCDPCRQLLAAIGAGERTELEERAGDVPSQEVPEHPQDY